MNRFSLLLKGFFGLLFLVLLNACNDDDSTPTIPDADVIVINEGNFSSGDASISTFNTVTDEVSLSVFTGQNSFPFEAIIQNVVEYNNDSYAVCNAVDKVEVFNSETFASVATIQPNAGDAIQFASPFSFAAVGNKGYISNWGTFNNTTFQFENSFLIVVDLTDFSIDSKIDLTVQPQHLLAIGNNIYIADVGGNTISILDTNTDTVTSTITVSNGPDRFLLDANDKLWVVCTSGNLVRINTSTNTVEATISNVQVANFNTKAVMNNTKDKIYYMSSEFNSDFSATNNVIYEMDITATSAPTNSIVSGENFYALGVDEDNILYVGITNAFQSNGKILRYNLDGTLIDEFICGRGPNGFIFR